MRSFLTVKGFFLTCISIKMDAAFPSPMDLRILGGASEVGSLSAHLAIDGVSLLFDCGLTPSRPPKYPMKPPAVDLGFLSHAHIDHSGMVPWLCANYGVDVVATQPSIIIGTMLLEDSVKVSASEGYPAPYDRGDVRALRRHFQEVRFGDTIEVGGIEVQMHSAGHIPGAAMFEVRSDRSILFTGDINTLDTYLVEGTFPVKCDTLVIESTYAGRNHPPRSSTEYEFLEKTKEVVDRGGIAIVPAFAVGRTQEMLLILAKSGLNIWLDGLGWLVNKEYVKMPDYLRSVQALRKVMSKTRVVRNQGDRRLALTEAEVIVTTSGMLDGGPVLTYLKETRTDPTSAVLLTGFQVEGTNGRRLMETGEMMFSGTTERIDCEMGFYDFSAHADHSELLRFINGCEPETVVLCHGDNRDELAEDLTEQGFDTRLPVEGDLIEL